MKQYMPTQIPEEYLSGHTITMLTDHFMQGLIHDLTCLTETMQTSLNIKKNSVNPIKASKHCEVLIEWTQLHGYVIRKNNLILIMELCS